MTPSPEVYCYLTWLGCVVTAAFWLRASYAADRAEADSNRAACEANIARLSRDPLDAEKASRELLEKIEAAGKRLLPMPMGKQDEHICAACGCPWGVHSCGGRDKCIDALRKRRME